jgi:hypothetical protein
MPLVLPSTGACRAEVSTAPPMGTRAFHVERGATAGPRGAIGPWLPSHGMPHLRQTEPGAAKLRVACLIRHAVRIKWWGPQARRLFPRGCWPRGAINPSLRRPMGAERGHAEHGCTARDVPRKRPRLVAESCSAVKALAPRSTPSWQAQRADPREARTAHARAQTVPESDDCGPRYARSARPRAHGLKAGRRGASWWREPASPVTGPCASSLAPSPPCTELRHAWTSVGVVSASAVARSIHLGAPEMRPGISGPCGLRMRWPLTRMHAGARSAARTRLAWSRG